MEAGVDCCDASSLLESPALTSIEDRSLFMLVGPPPMWGAVGAASMYLSMLLSMLLPLSMILLDMAISYSPSRKTPSPTAHWDPVWSGTLSTSC